MHYSYAQKPYLLKPWAEERACEIIELGHSSVTLVYSGMSGISAATALSLALYDKEQEHQMVYISKEFETSHGDSIEYGYFSGEEERVFLFVDDFISTGATKNYCLKKLNEKLKQCGMDEVEFNLDILQIG